MRTVRKLFSFNVLRSLLWIGFVAAGFVSRANAYDCYDQDTCICDPAWNYSYTYGTHCCYNACPDNPYGPYCGQTWGYHYWLNSCAINCATPSCSIKDYTDVLSGCTCDTCLT
jgi:hypothetical protein